MQALDEQNHLNNSPEDEDLLMDEETVGFVTTLCLFAVKYLTRPPLVPPKTISALSSRGSHLQQEDIYRTSARES